jgi:aryl-alcohol dehydrogenase-like predicted oxidoreductase
MMKREPTSPLVLGGHSFIQQLGNDPPLDEAGQTRLVEACLDQGIRSFDTTYQPERIALGLALARLGRRSEASILAWNFFTDFGPGEDVGRPAHYQPHNIDLMLTQLRTDWIDHLVVHAMGDPERDLAQEQLAIQWRKQGKVRELGCWHPSEDVAAHHPGGGPYQFMVRPRNVTHDANTERAFAACKALNWRTVACSPFGRGWELDRLVALASTDGLPAAEARSRLADHMLRHSLFGPNVDQLIVSIRRVDWVAASLASVASGPLAPADAQWLLDLRRRAATTLQPALPRSH